MRTCKIGIGTKEGTLSEEKIKSLESLEGWSWIGKSGPK
tara:strand:- start:471 stop:587 length:117 start_codon:yes stop_codon:yes gene_type:complete